MLSHSVYYWLKEDVSFADRAELEKGLRLMTTIPSVVHGFVRTPAPTKRPVIDSSYSHGLVLVFRDMAGHDEFQSHPAHVAFRDVCARCCGRVLVYDFHDK